MVLAAFTIFLIASFVSSHFRVFKPQSGFTQIFSFEITAAAFLSRSAISVYEGTRAE